MAANKFQPLQWLWAVRDTEFDNPKEQHLAYHLLAHADANGMCYPTVDRLCLILGVKQTQTKKLRGSLRKRGLLELVEKGDELLVDMLTNAVESRAGVRPDASDVADFLVGLAQPIGGQSPRGGSSPSTRNQLPPSIPSRTTNELSRYAKAQPEVLMPTRTTNEFASQSAVQPELPASPRARSTSESARSGELVILGKAYPYHNAKDALAIVLRELAKADDSFLERCSRHPDAQGRTRRYIARTPEELYPDREDFRGMRESLPGGWFVATHMNNVVKKTIIRLASEVAGLSFGKDVIVDL